MSRIATLIASAADIDTESVYIPKWDVTLEIRGMDGHGRARYLTKIMDARESDDQEALAQVEAEVLVECVIDPEDETQAFELTDIPMLLTKNGGIIGMLARKSLIASGLDAGAEERLGKASSASATKDVEPTPNGASTSTSPSDSA